MKDRLAAAIAKRIALDEARKLGPEAVVALVRTLPGPKVIEGEATEIKEGASSPSAGS